MAAQEHSKPRHTSLVLRQKLTIDIVDRQNVTKNAVCCRLESDGTRARAHTASMHPNRMSSVVVSRNCSRHMHS